MFFRCCEQNESESRNAFCHVYSYYSFLEAEHLYDVYLFSEQSNTDLNMGIYQVFRHLFKAEGSFGIKLSFCVHVCSSRYFASRLTGKNSVTCMNPHSVMQQQLQPQNLKQPVRPKTTLQHVLFQLPL